MERIIRKYDEREKEKSETEAGVEQNRRIRVGEEGMKEKWEEEEI